MNPIHELRRIGLESDADTYKKIQMWLGKYVVEVNASHRTFSDENFNKEELQKYEKEKIIYSIGYELTKHGLYYDCRPFKYQHCIKHVYRLTIIKPNQIKDEARRE